MPADPRASHVAVDRLMHEIEDDVRRARRARALARGASGDYEDPAIFESVDAVLRGALAARDHDALLLPHLLDGDDDWRVAPPLSISSHRPLVGPLLVFLKRRLMLPLTRWLYEYTHRGFTRQQRLNDILFACIEALAIENAKLRRQMGPEGQERREGQEGREGGAGGHATARTANPSASTGVSSPQGWDPAASAKEDEQ